MQKESAIEHSMRTTAKAQSNFIQEVKTMIKQEKKRDAKKHLQGFWEQINSSTNYEPASSYVKSQLPIDDKPLELTGV